MKILYYQDLHRRGVNSEFRLGNYSEDNLIKFKEILSLSKELDCNYIISGGDNFDSPNISLPMTDEFIDLIQNNQVLLYTIWGNHDENNHSIELSNGTTLNHIFKRTLMIKHLKVLETDKTYIKGYDYYHNIEQDIKDKGLICGIKNKFRIAVVHAFTTLKPFLPTVLHVPIKEIETDYDIILLAHYHQPWGIKIINDTKFINLGSIGRLDINEADIIPSVLFIDADTQETKIIPLKSAKPGSEVFDLTKVTKAKAFEEDIDKFIASLQTTTFTELDLRGIVEEVGKQKEIDREIIDNLIERIGKYD